MGKTTSAYLIGEGVDVSRAEPTGLQPERGAKGTSAHRAKQSLPMVSTNNPTSSKLTQRRLNTKLNQRVKSLRRCHRSQFWRDAV